MPNSPTEKTLKPDQRLTRKEIADLFSVSVETIKRRTSEGLLKPIFVNPRVIHYTVNDVRTMVEHGYYLDAKKALAAGIRPADIGFHAFGGQSAADIHPIEAAPPSAGLIPPFPISVPNHDFAAEVFLAQLRWALCQPAVKSQILRLLTEQNTTAAA